MSRSVPVDLCVPSTEFDDACGTTGSQGGHDPDLQGKRDRRAGDPHLLQVAPAHLELFGIGASWGGYESLAIPFDCTAFRTATRWEPGGPTVRFHIGLEAVEDLTADLERGFAALVAAAHT